MPPDPRYVEEWFRFAHLDLDGARVLALSDAHPILAMVQVQQAIEKALKGFLIGRGRRLERTHDLVYLLGQQEGT